MELKIHTEKPTTQKHIVALLSESLVGIEGDVEILEHCDFYDLRHPEGYYDEHGELIPESAIEKWFELPKEMYEND